MWFKHCQRNKWDGGAVHQNQHHFYYHVGLHIGGLCFGVNVEYKDTEKEYVVLKKIYTNQKVELFVPTCLLAFLNVALPSILVPPSMDERCNAKT